MQITYEQAKQMVARAEELEQAVKGGKRVEWLRGGQTLTESVNVKASEFFASMMHDYPAEYRIAPTKKRVPWTREEAFRHVGWVLVSPDGRRGLITSNEGEWVGHSGPHANPTLTRLYNEGWHVCLPGTPDDLKPCWTEVDE